MSDFKPKRKISQNQQEEDISSKTENPTPIKNIQTRGTLPSTFVKSSVFPVPQLLQQTKGVASQNDKINQNNKIIQDLLIVNKNQTQSNSQSAIATGSDSTIKLQSRLQQRIQESNPKHKMSIDIQKTDNQQVSCSNKIIEGDNNINLQQDQYLESKRVPVKTLQGQKRESKDSTLLNQKINSSVVSFLNAKQKNTEIKPNQLSVTTQSALTKGNHLTQSVVIKTQDAYGIKPISTAQSNRRNQCNSDVSSLKSLRDIKSSDQQRFSFRINEKVNLTQRNSSIYQSNVTSNQGNYSINQSNPVINIGNSNINQANSSVNFGNSSINQGLQSQKAQQTQQNLLMTPQQHFVSSQLPSPTNTLNGSKMLQSYYTQSTSADPAQLFKNEKDQKYSLKFTNINKSTIEYGNQFSPLQPEFIQSQNSLRPLQKTMNQLDLSQIGNQTTTQSDLTSTQRSLLNQNIPYNTAGVMTNKSKKFAQSFTQLTKIINQHSPEKSPNEFSNFTLKMNNNKDIQVKSIIMDKIDPSPSIQYENSLKKEISSAFSESPATRQDVIQMQKWLQIGLNQIQKMNSSKKTDHLASIIDVSCKELIRQISVECQERGELLQTVMRYSVLSYQEQIQTQNLNFHKYKKSSEDEYLKSHKVYQEIFQSKESQIDDLKKDLNDLKDKLNENVKEMEQNLKNDKNLREQLTRFKDLAQYMQKKQNESKIENHKLKSKINKATQQKQSDRRATIQQIQEKNFVLLHDDENKNIDTNPKNKSLNTSINSDLFNIDENQQSERLINTGHGVSESIDKLNCVRYTNPDDVKKCDAIQTQTGASLLILNDMREVEVQTCLENLIDDEYDQILKDKLTFDQFMYKIENIESQVEYLKQREINLIEQLESMKTEKIQIGEGFNNSQFQITQVASPLLLQVNTPQSRFSGQDFDIASFVSLTPGRKKKQDDVDTVLTEKYKNIMQKLNLDSNNISAFISSDSSEDEQDVDTPLSQDEKAAKKAKRISLIKAVQKKTNNRQLGEKINQVESLFNDVGKQIVEKIKKNKYHKFRNFMPLPTLLKQINLVYLERMKMVNENPRIKEQECSNFTYYFLTKLYGFKKIVDQKFIIFMLSIKKYLTVLRVNLFARFIGLLENRTANFSLDECNKYIEVLNYVFNISNAGQQPSPYEHDSHYMVPYIRAMAFVGNFADSRMTIEENNEFKKDIEQLKENDPKGVHTAGLIDFDVFLNKMLAKYRQLVNRAKTYVINAFAASDLDGNGVCNLDEFLILNRHIEVDLYDEDVLTQIFQENVDRIIDGEQNLSFDRFAVVCVDYNLFSDEAQDKFLAIRHKREIDFKMQELQTEWVFRKRELKTIFEQLLLITQESKQKWLEIIEVLSEKLKTSTQSEYKPLLIAYKILTNESRLLLSLEEECKRDEDLLNQYQLQALKDQKDQHQSFQLMESSGQSDGSLHIHQRHMKQRSSGNQSGIQQMLQIPIGNSMFSLSAQKKMSQYANQPQSSNISSSPVFTFSNCASPQLAPQTSVTSILNINSSSNLNTNTLNAGNIESSLKDANFIELMLQKLKNMQNKEKYLINILLKNGVEEPSENDITQIQDIIIALDQPNNVDNEKNARQLLFQFLMRQINSNSKKSINSQTLIQ